MTRKQYLKLRTDAYKLVGVIGTEAEKYSDYAHGFLVPAYSRGSEMLDQIDELGYKLGILNPETNDVVDRRYKETK